MTREDIKKIFPDATDEAITAMLNAHHSSMPKPKATDEELTALREKAAAYDKAQQEQMTIEEQAKQALAEAEKLRVENLRILNRTKALNEFVKGGLTAEEAETFVDSVVTEDEATTITNVQAICKVFKDKSEALVKSTKEELLKTTPKPDDKGSGSPGASADVALAQKLAQGTGAAPGDSLKYYTGG